MATVATPTGVADAISKDTPNTSVDVSWKLEDPNASGLYNFRFVDKANPNTIIPINETPVTVTLNDKHKGTTTLDVSGSLGNNDVAKFIKKHQIQVQALATDGNTESAWGKQIYYMVAGTVTITVGGTTISLGGGGTSSVYSLLSPVTITRGDLQSFIDSTPFDFTIPDTWPNGDPVQSTLTIDRFSLDTSNKTFAIKATVHLDWTIIEGKDAGSPLLRADSVGLQVLRTDGTPLP